jgi:hypothetical protein
MNWSVIFLVIFSLSGVYALLRNRKKPLADIELTKKAQVIALVVIGIAAVVVRVWQFGSVPGGFNQDGAMAAVDAMALADHGTDRFGMPLPVHFTAWGYGQMSVLMSYLMAPFIKLFGLSAVTARLPMLLVSLAGLVALYLLCKDVFGRLPALIILAVTAVNPWHIMQSRWALDCNMLPHFLLFSAYFLHLGRKRKVWLYIAMVFFGLTMYTYGIAFYAVPLMLILLCIVLLAKRMIKAWEAGLCLLVYAAVAWPIFAVMIINYFRLHTIRFLGFTIPFFPDSVRSGDLVIFSPDVFGQLWANIVSFVNVIILQKPGLPWNAIPAFGPMYLFALPLIILGIVWMIKTRREDKTIGRITIVVWLIISVLSALMINGININRINIIFYPLCILCGLGIWYLATAIRVKVVLPATALIFALAFSTFTVSYFGAHSKVLAANFYSGFGEALAAAEEEDADTIYVTNYTQFENSYYVSEILTLFHSAIDAEYYTGEAQVYSSDGHALLPYQQRYQYISFSAPVSADKNAVYVINMAEKNLFALDVFDIDVYDGYALAIPKSFQGGVS